MIQATNRYGIYEVDRTKFGGLIKLSDFNTDYRGKDNTYGSPIAQRIISDWKFDEQCRKNVESRNIRKNK
jgi:hypothetical protein